MIMTIDEQLNELSKIRLVIEHTWLSKYITLETEHTERNADVNVQECAFGRLYIKQSDESITPLGWTINPQLWQSQSNKIKAETLARAALKSPIMTDEVVKVIEGAEKGIIEL